MPRWMERGPDDGLRLAHAHMRAAAMEDGGMGGVRTKIERTVMTGVECVEAGVVCVAKKMAKWCWCTLQHDRQHAHT